MKFTVLIPVADNSGNMFPEVKLRAIFDRFGFQFGGRTVEGPVDGMWVDAGIAYFDRSYKVTVVTSNDRLDEARSLVREIGQELDQLAMYLEVVADEGVEILRIE